jgi:hypothetical protein
VDRLFVLENCNLVGNMNVMNVREFSYEENFLNILKEHVL